MLVGAAPHPAARLYQKRGQTNVWITPKEITDALGPFDLDPCAAEGQPWQHAACSYTQAEDGLKQSWMGRVWMNPPYAPKDILLFVQKFVEHHNGIALVFPRTDTRWFHTLASSADLLFLKSGRIRFCRLDGSPAGGFLGSVFVAAGQENADALLQTGWAGQYLRSYQSAVI